MTATKVDAAVAAIERRDPSLGGLAQVAADGLTAGNGEEMLTQAGVQDFLWYRLPSRYPDETWLPIARATVALLEELGLHRYAASAGSAMTWTVLEAWAEDNTRGVARYRAAAEASGVKPLSTELLGWGSVMGLDEASAYSHMEWELEGRSSPARSCRAPPDGEHAPRCWLRTHCGSRSAGDGRRRMGSSVCRSFIVGGRGDTYRRVGRARSSSRGSQGSRHFSSGSFLPSRSR